MGGDFLARAVGPLLIKKPVHPGRRTCNFLDAGEHDAVLGEAFFGQGGVIGTGRYSLVEGKKQGERPADRALFGGDVFKPLKNFHFDPMKGVGVATWHTLCAPH